MDQPNPAPPAPAPAVKTPPTPQAADARQPILIVAIILLILLIGAFVYWGWQNKSKKQQSAPPTTITEGTQSAQTLFNNYNDPDTGISFEYFRNWKITKKDGGSFAKSKSAFLYQFDDQTLDASGSAIMSWTYKLKLYSFDPADDLEGLAKKIAGDSVKTSPCPNNPNCLILKEGKNNQIQTVFKGTKYAYGLRMEKADGQEITTDMPIGPFQEVFPSIKAE